METLSLYHTDTNQLTTNLGNTQLSVDDRFNLIAQAFTAGAQELHRQNQLLSSQVTRMQAVVDQNNVEKRARLTAQAQKTMAAIDQTLAKDKECKNDIKGAFAVGTIAAAVVPFVLGAPRVMFATIPTALAVGLANEVCTSPKSQLDSLLVERFVAEHFPEAAESAEIKQKAFVIGREYQAAYNTYQSELAACEPDESWNEGGGSAGTTSFGRFIPSYVPSYDTGRAIDAERAFNSANQAIQAKVSALRSEVERSFYFS